ALDPPDRLRDPRNAGRTDPEPEGGRSIFRPPRAARRRDQVRRPIRVFPPVKSPPPGKPLAPTVTSVDVTRRFAPGTLVAGRYRIVSVAGVGGMGVVYRARDEELGVDAALKVLRPDLGNDPAVLERFRSELRLAREVTHKNVVRIHDIGEHEGLRFLTMRYVEGRSLSEVLEREGPMPPERAVSIVKQVASALGEAHR